MIGPAVAELEGVVGTSGACALLGKPRATLYRQRRPVPPRASTPRGAPPNALSRAEREEVLALLHRPEYCDLAVGQVWARELDAGRYHASMRTMYRILEDAGEAGERRRHATHPARTRPELCARAPNDVWSWDITRLAGPRRGVWFYLYVMIDIFSRYVPGWAVQAAETGELAEPMLAAALGREGIGRGQLTVHADRGGPMTSKPVTELLADLRVARTHGRPRVSNDNPYSEAAFKTLKYCPAFPERFGSIQDARGFCAAFFDAYNHEHRHSALGWHTPASVHFGTAAGVRQERARTLDAAYAAHPERFARPPTPPRLPSVAWINPPQQEVIVTR